MTMGKPMTLPRIIPTALCVWSCALLAFAFCMPARAADITVQVVPSKLELPEADAQDSPAAAALVLLKNTGDKRWSNARLSWFLSKGAGIIVTAAPTGHREIGRGATMSWELKISRSPGTRLPGDLHLRVDFKSESGLEQSEFAELSLVPATRALPSPGLEAKVESSSASLTQFRPMTLYLEINNRTDAALDIESIEWRKPEKIKLEATKGTPASFTAPPQTAMTLAYDATYDTEVKKAIVPGKYFVIFEIKYKGPQGWSPPQWKGVQTAKFAVDVGVFGEREFLSLSQVPTFLILPGLLMLVTFSLVWRLWPGTTYPLTTEWQKPEFWVLSVTLSLLTAYIYPIVTKLLDVPRNYLEGYEFIDIVWVWFGSILVVIIAHLVVWSAVRGYAAWLALRYKIDPNDGPLDVLQKLANQRFRIPPGKTIMLPRVVIQRNGTPTRLYLLEPKDHTGDKCWVSPAIQVDWTPPTATQQPSAGKDPLPETPQKAFDAAMRPQANLKMAVKLLREGVGKKAVKLDWLTVSGISGPLQINRAEIVSNEEASQYLMSPE